MNFSQLRTRVLFLALILTVGVSLSLHTYHERKRIEQSDEQARFKEQARTQGIRAQQHIDEALQVLKAFSALFAASEQVTRQEFQAFAKRLLPARKELTAIHWAPRVPHEQRFEYEAALRQEGLAAEGFFDVPDTAEQQQPSPERPLYFPLFFTEPLVGANRKAPGLDVASRFFNTTPLEQSARYGVPYSTSAFSTVQDPHGPLAVAIFQPIYQAQALEEALLNESPKAETLKGYLVLILRPEVLLAEHLGRLQGATLGMRLVDTDNGQIIYPLAPSLANKPPSNARTYPYPLSIPGRHWLLTLYQGDQTDQERDWMAEWLLLCMLCLSVVTTLSMAMGMQQVSRLQLAYQRLTQQSRKLHQLARHDPLTGLANRISLEEHVHLILANEDRLQTNSAICMLDLDNFKQVNDQLGHNCGDQLLQSVANTLKRNLRKGDLAARLGGDEFVLVLPLTHRKTNEVAKAMQRIQEQIAVQAANLTEGKIPVSASIGITLSHQGCRQFDTLLQQADEAMYQAKQQGKNRYCFFSPPPSAR